MTSTINKINKDAAIWVFLGKQLLKYNLLKLTFRPPWRWVLALSSKGLAVTTALLYNHYHHRKPWTEDVPPFTSYQSLTAPHRRKAKTLKVYVL